MTYDFMDVSIPHAQIQARVAELGAQISAITAARLDRDRHSRVRFCSWRTIRAISCRWPLILWL